MNQLANIDTDLFVVVSELPTEDIKEGKIYCIKDTSSTAQDNGYIEYAYINNKWEKIGQFQAEPDLSGYAKLSGAFFTGNVTLNNVGGTHTILGKSYIEYPSVRNVIVSRESPNNHTVFGTAGNFLDVGTPENFVFTLEDGTNVTKSIRVISTTTSQNVVNNNGGEDGE